MKSRDHQASLSSESTPPYNPGLYQLVRGKQAWAEPPDDCSKQKGFLGWHQRGYLPHHDIPGVTQFVTFRLADAMPVDRRSEWELLLRIEDDRLRRVRLEQYLDRGMGGCYLRRPELAKLTENALRFFEGKRYALRAWVVMPNHVHLVVDIWVPLAKLIHSWNGFTGREANKKLGIRKAFWEREYWDTRIVDDEHLRKAIHYTESNPVKAGLVKRAQDFPSSSARFRKEGSLPR